MGGTRRQPASTEGATAEEARKREEAAEAASEALSEATEWDLASVTPRIAGMNVPALVNDNGTVRTVVAAWEDVGRSHLSESAVQAAGSQGRKRPPEYPFAGHNPWGPGWPCSTGQSTPSTSQWRTAGTSGTSSAPPRASGTRRATPPATRSPP